MQKITLFLWFDDNAEEAIKFYTSLFKNSKIHSMSHYGGGPMKGKVMAAQFSLEGQEFMAMDAGPEFKFTEAISLFVDCKSQKEVDELWAKLTADGGKESQCGWLKDKYGMSWQIIPSKLRELLFDKDPERAKRVLDAMLRMKKIVIKDLEKAYQQQ
jgi:predicted 3-demethylubiquinone-9 3-methyltransferase (glyoxalase superfamily)